MDDVIYFSPSKQVETLFESKFKNKIDIEFNGRIGYFLGINFTCTTHDTGEKTIHLGQEAFIDNLAVITKLQNPHMSCPKTPYRSGYPVDKIPSLPTSHQNQPALTKTMHQLVGCFNWLAISTRPDIATITNILSKYTAQPTLKHLDHARYVIKYLIGSKSQGICFSSKHNSSLQSFVKFPINNPQISTMCDANWGPQDASVPRTDNPPQLELFKSRSISGH